MDGKDKLFLETNNVSVVSRRIQGRLGYAYPLKASKQAKVVPIQKNS